MKDLIKQILREQILGLSNEEVNYHLPPKIIEAGYKLMNIIIKDYEWYTATTPTGLPNKFVNSIWLIKPKYKQSLIFVTLREPIVYYHKSLIEDFEKYLNMNKGQFKLFMAIWMEDFINRKIFSVELYPRDMDTVAEYVLKNGKQIK